MLEKQGCSMWQEGRPGQMATFIHRFKSHRVLVINSHAPHMTGTSDLMSTDDMQAALRAALNPRRVLNAGLKNLQAIVFAGDFNRNTNRLTTNGSHPITVADTPKSYNPDWTRCDPKGQSAIWNPD